METLKLKIAGISVLALVALTSCNDNDRKVDNDQMINDSIRMADENRMEQERLEREENSVFAMVEEDTVLTIFAENLEINSLSQEFIEEEGPYTIFAPSDVAYESLSAEDLDVYEDPLNSAENSARLQYLVVDDEFTTQELRNEVEAANGRFMLTSMQGEDITVTLEGDAIVLADASGNKARIIETDLDASNGIVHVIDKVLVPSDVKMNAARDMQNNQNRTENTNSNTSTGA